MTTTTGESRVVSINVGKIRTIEWHGRVVRTGIWKTPVGPEPVMVRGTHVEGDEQADPTVHGGPDKAVYAYAAEDYRYWIEVEGVAAGPGLFGENLTTVGLDLRVAQAGERWHIGTALLEVTQPRLPCFKLGMRLADPAFPRRFQAAGRFGTYLRVLESGAIRVGDRINVEPPPAP
ncbi:MAG: MOSC domain-containing protein [Gemmatimonadota bacterium]